MLKRTILLSAGAMLVAATAWAAGQTLTVQVRELRMRSTPSFTGGLAGPLSYGQEVNVLEEQGAWTRVQGPKSAGWVHKSALTDRQLNLASGSGDVSAEAGDREVSMAGKGFNSSTEREYRQTHPDGYGQVEAMLKITYSPEALQSFLKAGQVRPGGGQ